MMTKEKLGHELTYSRVGYKPDCWKWVLSLPGAPGGGAASPAKARQDKTKQLASCSDQLLSEADKFDFDIRPEDIKHEHLSKCYGLDKLPKTLPCQKRCFHNPWCLGGLKLGGTGKVGARVPLSQQAREPPTIPVGLQNTANTCWINSALQLFFHLRKFRNAINSMPDFRGDASLDTLVHLLQVVFAEMELHPFKAIACEPGSVFEKLGMFASREVMKKDANNELLKCVSEFMENTIDWLVADTRLASVVSPMFTITLTRLAKWQCSKCGTVHQYQLSPASCYTMGAYISADQAPLQQCLMDLQAETQTGVLMVCGGSSPVKGGSSSPGCGATVKVDRVVTPKLDNLPYYLIIRNNSLMDEDVKRRLHVVYPENLNLSEHTLDGRPAHYVLSGVVFHHGHWVKHYSAQVKTEGGAWFSFNDESVLEMSHKPTTNSQGNPQENHPNYFSLAAVSSKYKSRGGERVSRGAFIWLYSLVDMQPLPPMVAPTPAVHQYIDRHRNTEKSVDRELLLQIQSERQNLLKELAVTDPTAPHALLSESLLFAWLSSQECRFVVSPSLLQSDLWCQHGALRPLLAHTLKCVRRDKVSKLLTHRCGIHTTYKDSETKHSTNSVLNFNIYPSTNNVSSSTANTTQSNAATMLASLPPVLNSNDSLLCTSVVGSESNTIDSDTKLLNVSVLKDTVNNPHSAEIISPFNTSQIINSHLDCNLNPSVMLNSINIPITSVSSVNVNYHSNSGSRQLHQVNSVSSAKSSSLFSNSSDSDMLLPSSINTLTNNVIGTSDDTLNSKIASSGRSNFVSATTSCNSSSAIGRSSFNSSCDVTSSSSNSTNEVPTTSSKLTPEVGPSSSSNINISYGFASTSTSSNSPSTFSSLPPTGRNLPSTGSSLPPTGKASRPELSLVCGEERQCRQCVAKHASHIIFLEKLKLLHKQCKKEANKLQQDSYLPIGCQTLELWPKIAARNYIKTHNIELSLGFEAPSEQTNDDDDKTKLKGNAETSDNSNSEMPTSLGDVNSGGDTAADFNTLTQSQVPDLKVEEIAGYKMFNEDLVCCHHQLDPQATKLYLPEATYRSIVQLCDEDIHPATVLDDFEACTDCQSVLVASVSACERGLEEKKRLPALFFDRRRPSHTKDVGNIVYLVDRDWYDDWRSFVRSCTRGADDTRPVLTNEDLFCEHGRLHYSPVLLSAERQAQLWIVLSEEEWATLEELYGLPKGGTIRAIVTQDGLTDLHPDVCPEGCVEVQAVADYEDQFEYDNELIYVRQVHTPDDIPQRAATTRSMGAGRAEGRNQTETMAQKPNICNTNNVSTNSYVGSGSVTESADIIRSVPFSNSTAVPSNSSASLETSNSASVASTPSPVLVMEEGKANSTTVPQDYSTTDDGSRTSDAPPSQMATENSHTNADCKFGKETNEKRSIDALAEEPEVPCKVARLSRECRGRSSSDRPTPRRRGAGPSRDDKALGARLVRASKSFASTDTIRQVQNFIAERTSVWPMLQTVWLGWSEDLSVVLGLAPEQHMCPVLMEEDHLTMTLGALRVKPGDTVYFKGAKEDMEKAAGDGIVEYDELPM